MLVKYKYQTHSKFPRCGHDNEHTNHVLQCRESGADLIWKNEMTKLQTWLETHDLHPELVQVIITGLNTWRTGSPNPYIPTTNSIRQAQIKQNRIGWFQFIEGFWTKDFLNVQQNLFTIENITKSSTLLLSKAQRRIWMVAWAMWEQRNLFLHDTNQSFHPQELKAIDTEIQYELGKGLANLAPTYSPLFSINLPSFLETSHVNKLNWITTIWTVRELNNPAYFLDNDTDMDPLTRYRYLRWKQQL